MWREEHTSFIYPEHLDNSKINIVNLVMRFIDSINSKKDAIKLIRSGSIKINDEVINDISKDIEIKNDIKTFLETICYFVIFRQYAVCTPQYRVGQMRLH